MKMKLFTNKKTNKLRYPGYRMYYFVKNFQVSVP